MPGVLHEACQIRRNGGIPPFLRVLSRNSRQFAPPQIGIFHQLSASCAICEWPLPGASPNPGPPMALDRITLARFRNHDASRLDGSAQAQPAGRRERRGQDQRARGAVAARAGPRAAPRGARRDGRGRRPAASRSAPSSIAATGASGSRSAPAPAPSGPGGGWSRSTAPRAARRRSANGSRSAG